VPYKDLAKQRAAQARWGRENRDITTKHRATNRAQKYAMVNALKKAPCTDCGETYLPCVMDFDHVRGIKVSNVGLMLTKNNGWGIAKLCQLKYTLSPLYAYVSRLSRGLGIYLKGSHPPSYLSS